jgi:DNA-binding response OmpR family regulator
VERASKEQGNTAHRRQTDGAQILVVEDNDDFRLLLELTLRTAGYRVDCAASSEDGIRLLRERTYELVLSDYGLPGLSGAWLISQAAAVSERAVPSLLITGDPDAPGIPVDVPVIPKPVDFDRLLVQVRALLASGETTTDRKRDRARARFDAISHLGRMPGGPGTPDDSAAL